MLKKLFIMIFIFSFSLIADNIFDGRAFINVNGHEHEVTDDISKEITKWYKSNRSSMADEMVVGIIRGSDFNNDGIRDIAYVTNSFATPYGVGGENKLVVLYMNTEGDTTYSFVIHHHQFHGVDFGGLFQLLEGDFNNDNYQDILIVTNASDIIVFNDTIGGFLTGENDYQITGGGDLDHCTTIGDINGDGWKGLVYNYLIGANELALTSIVRNDSGDFKYNERCTSQDGYL